MIENWLKEKRKKQKNDTERRCANQRSSLAILNVKVSNQQFEINGLKAENDRLREALKSQIKALLALKGFYPETSLFADDNIRRIRQVLNGKSEE